MTAARSVPRDSVELEVTRIYEDLLGVDGVDVHADFFTLGGHSLLAVQLLARIKKTFGTVVPVSVLFEHADEEAASVAMLSGLVRHGLGGRQPDSPAGPVTLRRGDGGGPVFCVHPAGGDLIAFRELVRLLPPERPVYGLPAPPADTDPYEPELSDIAEHHLARLTEAQPSGPYSLIGWSMGGVLAAEMAGRLRAAGARVDLLALVDSYPAAETDAPGETEILSAFATHLGGVLGRPFAVPADDLRALSFDDGLARVLAAARAAGALPPGTDITELLTWLTLFRAHDRARRRHRAVRPVEELLLVFASDADPLRRDRAADSWQRITERPVRRHVVPGDHYSMLTEPHVRELATILTDALRAPAERS
ncbi:alpha/beta fold hydrolase [Micromonospora sp. LOL_025]|uniref:alpha/beta fold hydrolase n=1 Tax=Micromonospora sp. LOL_025 TaxID=3345413 RepID=UPI003A857F82